jgi:hypothetical protein
VTHELQPPEHRPQAQSQSALDAAQAAQRMAEATHAAVNELKRLALAGMSPAIVRAVALSAKNGGVIEDAIGHAPEGTPDVSRSIGVLNPYGPAGGPGAAPAGTTALDVYLGLGGASGSPGALVIAQGKALILPANVGDVELGIAQGAVPADNAPVRVWLLRFANVQPFYYGP